MRLGDSTESTENIPGFFIPTGRWDFSDVTLFYVDDNSGATHSVDCQVDRGQRPEGVSNEERLNIYLVRPANMAEDMKPYNLNRLHT